LKVYISQGSAATNRIFVAALPCSAKNRTFEQKRFFRARMTPSQSLMATDGALKLNYASVTFVLDVVKSLMIVLSQIFQRVRQ